MPATRELQIRIDLDEEHPANHPVVTLLIDGEDLLGKLGSGFIGFDPAEVLDSGALLPLDPPRRVALYRCRCGEAGCGCVAMTIEHRDDQVVWSDARDYTGVYAKPLYDGEPRGGMQHGIGDLRFDARHYLSEVRRAMLDRSWESEPRRTARLLRGHLLASVHVLSDQGYWLGWIGPHWERAGVFQVDFTGPAGQVVVELEAPSGTPEQQAKSMADDLLTTDPSDWSISIRNTWPEDVVEGSRDARARSLQAELERRGPATTT